ncbi:DUF1572 family protein [Gimesia fumaroli]|uniref:DinB superfamily protein n=1 Tax=Gimesia fumaroli TaxID=2527976 RepID=A0A518I623_9PLAN|nr:DUF1572 family protein [Gimesia fumaroli]QDV48533.1 hypothetical protein Enr17x_05460 [Gimesia fumaroli]
MAPSADEITHEFIQELVHLLEQSRHKIKHCLNQLDLDQIWWRPETGLNSVGNLMLHLCGNLNQWAVCGINGLEDKRQREQEFSSERRLTRDELEIMLNHTIEQACQVMQSLSASTLLEKREIQGFSVSVLGALSHTVPHFVGHTHQIIYLTRLQTGDQYQFDWSPDSEKRRVPI